MRTTWWESGKYNAICDVCGFKFKNTELRQRWDGFMVCKTDWEIRHPQELIRPVPDQRPLPWTRHEPADQFVQVTSIIHACSLDGGYSQADVGEADCAIVGMTSGSFLSGL